MIHGKVAHTFGRLTRRRVLTILGAATLTVPMVAISPERASAVVVTPITVEVLAAGVFHTCGLTPTGAADCWGNNFYGQAADHAGSYTQLTTSDAHTCGLTPTGAADCWGNNNLGQAAAHAGPYTQLTTGNGHTCGLTPTGAADCWGDNNLGQAAAHAGPYTQLTAGNGHTCGLTPTGAADCWGNNSRGQAAAHAGPYTQLTTGDLHSCGLTATGAADCWGYNGSGQAAAHAGPYTQLVGGSFHTCGLTPAGAADCWGDNGSGQAAAHAGPYTQLAAGSAHTCGLTAAGAVDCWGASPDGQAAAQVGPYGVYVPPTPPSVTIDQASGQADPTATSPVHFTAVFSTPVTGFATGDVTLSGTANATTATVTETAPNDGTTYDIAVTGMTTNGTITATIAAGAATAAIGNIASASTDNTVTYIGIDTTAPMVTSVERLDPVPTQAVTVRYRVNFSEAVTGVDVTDFTLTTTGTLSGNTVTDVSGTGNQRIVTLTTQAATGAGTIVLNIVDDDTIIDAATNPLGGTGAGNGNFTTNDQYHVAWPSLTITKTHTGNFTQGQTSAIYSINVANAGTFQSFGFLTVVDTLPAGLTATSIDGTDWGCTLATLTCTSLVDKVPANTALSPITVTVTVAANAAVSVTNTATLTGGPLTSPLNATDPTTIAPVVVGPTIGLIPDPCIAGKTALLVTGTGAAEYVSIKDGDHGRIKVSINNRIVGTYTPTGTIIVSTVGGADRIVVESDIKHAQLLFGGEGPDSIQSAQGRAVIIGGSGDDKLDGYKGRDIIIGGAGVDTLRGRDNDDILIAGLTVYDAPTITNMTSLCTAHARWARTDLTYTARVANLTSAVIAATSDDSSKDTLQGDSGTDWYIANRVAPGAVLDTLVDRKPGETLAEL